jgi:hypothetical protein
MRVILVTASETRMVRSKEIKGQKGVRTRALDKQPLATFIFKYRTRRKSA